VDDLPQEQAIEWIRTRGLPPMFGLGLGLVVFMFAFGTALLLFLQSGGRPSLPPPLLAGLFSFLAVIGAFVLIVPWIQNPRAVGLSSAGVTLRYLHQRVTLPWRDLMNVRYVTDKVVVFRPLSDPTSLGGWYQVSLSQARGILTDSRCPEVLMPEAQRHLLLDGPPKSAFQ
jgi:hypothetical protein